jgi:HEAT repeat protein
VDRAALDQAFEALQAYDSGSSRAALLPIDVAVAAALGNTAERIQVERRLLAALQAKPSVVAREYLCRKLVLVGSAASVPALADLLADPDLAHVACIALEALPGPEAAQALRDRLPRLRGLHQAGAIASLGRRRDRASRPALARLLEEPDLAIAGAAAAALGNLGTPDAARTLRRFLPKSPEGARAAVADACLACAERLRTAGASAAARALYQALRSSPQPSQVQEAARRGLEVAGGGSALR